MVTPGGDLNPVLLEPESARPSPLNDSLSLSDVRRDVKWVSPRSINTRSNHFRPNFNDFGAADRDVIWLDKARSECPMGHGCQLHPIPATWCLSVPRCSTLVGPRGTWLIVLSRDVALPKEISKVLIFIVSQQIRRCVKNGLSCVKTRTLLMLKMHESAVFILDPLIIKGNSSTSFSIYQCLSA